MLCSSSRIMDASKLEGGIYDEVVMKMVITVIMNITVVVMASVV